MALGVFLFDDAKIAVFSQIGESKKQAGYRLLVFFVLLLSDIMHGEGESMAAKGSSMDFVFADSKKVCTFAS